MQENKPWAQPVPESEPRPYTELEVRLLSLITQIYAECEDDRRGGMANCHPLQQLVQQELAKHPSLQELCGRQNDRINQLQRRLAEAGDDIPPGIHPDEIPNEGTMG